MFKVCTALAKAKFCVAPRAPPIILYLSKIQIADVEISQYFLGTDIMKRVESRTAISANLVIKLVPHTLLARRR